MGTATESVIRTVGICETQPVTTAGFRVVLEACPDLRFIMGADTLGGATDLVRRKQPNVLVIDKAFGAQSLLQWISDRQAERTAVAVVVWGVSISEAEALRLLQGGVKGIVRKTADPETIISCVRVVGGGSNWMEDSLFRETPRTERYARSELTPREQQVLELVEQGMKNREIARDLGIRPGTVKIHLKHIFEKTGVRGRYGLAISGLQEKGILELSHV
jgi:DNA-binding NarL/FixJ family response regulator